MSFSTDDEAEDVYEDEPDYSEDWEAATIGYLAATMPPRAAAPPVASTSSSRAADKGKGKEGDVADEEASQEQDIPERIRNKEELTKLAAVDDYTVQSLLRHDPTPVASLSTSTKLIKALHLIQQAYQASHPEIPSLPEARFDVGVARAPDPFPLATYASLLELVGSALSDINQSPFTFTARAGAASKSKKTVYELQLERARLSLDPSRQWTSPPTVLNGWGAIAPPSELSKEQKEDHDLANLYADNTRAALLILRPPILDPPPSDPSALSHAEPSSSADPFAAPTSFCPIASLPEELLSTIFSLARTAAEQRLEGAGLNGDGIYDEYGNPRSASAIQRRRMPGSFEGSRTAAQRFTLSLSLVCKDWRAPTRRIAFRSLHCRKMGQMERLLKLLDDSPEGEELAGYISELNAKVLRAPDLGMSVGRSRGYGRFVAAGGGGWGAASALGAGGSAAAAAALEKEEESPGFLFAQLVGKATNLRSLVLNLAGGSPYSIGFGAAGRQGVAEFLEPPVLNALSSIPTLQSLSLDFSIDFEELEVIVLGLPSLTSLALQAVDSINGSGVVASQVPHASINLRSIRIGDSQQFRDLTSITDAQLAWLLEPSASAGNLQEIDITVMSSNGAGWGPLGGGVQPNQPPPFASGVVADLLLRTAPALTRLALRDLSALGGGGAHATFGNAPHSGNFDHLLSHCTSLTDLTVQFAYTGPALLDSLRSTSHLTTLILLGTPTQIRAEDLAMRLEGPVQDVDQFEHLERLIVSGSWFQGAGGWSGASVREIKRVCKERKRKVFCSFASA